MKIGFIQVRGAGDCIIAMPIAKWYYDQGHEIYWTIENIFCEAFQYAFPYVNFIPIAPELNENIKANIRSHFWYERPRKKLDDIGMDLVFNFCYEELKYADKLQDLNHRRLDNPSKRAEICKIPNFTSFDTFKYAMAEVPLLEKWNLKIKRNRNKEIELYNQIIKDKNKPYIITHLVSEFGTYDLTKILSKEYINNYLTNYYKEFNLIKNAEIIEITPITDNIFDWITILENCSVFIGIDSFFVNLIDQLNIDIPKKYYVRKTIFSEWCVTLGQKWDYLPISYSKDENELKTKMQISYK